MGAPAGLCNPMAMCCYKLVSKELGLRSQYQIQNKGKLRMTCCQKRRICSGVPWLCDLLQLMSTTCWEARCNPRDGLRRHCQRCALQWCSTRPCSRRWQQLSFPIRRYLGKLTKRLDECFAIP